MSYSKRKIRLKKIKKFICKLIGHRVVWTIESRLRADGTKVKKHCHTGTFGNYTNGHGRRGNKRHYVQVGYYQCLRCGEKLTKPQKTSY